MRRPVNAAGRTADVQRLAGVFFEVHALDADTHDLAVYLDVEVAVDAERLVVLRNLKVLRHVGIEIVLSREPTPRRDRAVQSETDADRGFDRHRIRHRQRTGQAETGRAGMRVRGGAEGRRATAEHLRRGAEFDVRLEPEHRLELGERVVVGGHSAGAWSMSGAPQRSLSATSSAAPTRYSRSSAIAGAITWKPT